MTKPRSDYSEDTELKLLRRLARYYKKTVDYVGDPAICGCEGCKIWRKWKKHINLMQKPEPITDN